MKEGSFIRELEIILETEDKEVSAYLDGWLHGIHDVGWIRSEKISAFENKHRWNVRIYEKRFYYASEYMTPERIREDLTSNLRFIGFISDLSKIRKINYKIQVHEIKPEPALVEQGGYGSEFDF